MPGPLLPASPELKGLLLLIRRGHLCEVREVLRSNLQLKWKKGDRRQSPLLIAIRTGFYSLVEVMLEAGVGKDEMCCTLSQALDLDRLDMIQLLCSYGADPKTIPYEYAFRARDPMILRWLEDNGIEWITDNPVAMAIKFNRRAALGTMARCKGRLPQLLEQANMALRHHADEGSMYWVCRLLWVGADPRAVVPMIDPRWSGDEPDTALADAVSGGHFEIVEKFGIDPTRDDLDQLLYASVLTPNKQIVTKLLSLGANPCSPNEQNLLERCRHALCVALEREYSRSYDHRTVVDVVCLFAQRGARWQPQGDFRYLRSALVKAGNDTSIETLGRLIDSGLISQTVFKELMSAPRMREILNSGRPGAPRLREIAEISPAMRRRR